MKTEFRIGDKVSWKYEKGKATGVIKKIHTTDFPFNGETHHASTDDPQYEIQSDRIGNMAVRKAHSLSMVDKDE